MARQATTTTSVPEDAVQMRGLGRDGMEVEERTKMQDRKPNEGIHSGLTGAEDIEPQIRSAEEAKEYPTGLRFWLIILSLGALLVLGGLDTNIVATAVPRYV
jgi:hypothetical protein